MDASKKSPSSSGSPLVCPSCGREHAASKRFCEHCRMPLVTAGGEVIEVPLSEAHERARKIDPRYSRGRLVPVAGARQQPEAEMIQGLLLDGGMPSLVRRSAGFDVPDFLAAGPRDILVPESGVDAARGMLLQSGLESRMSAIGRPDPRQLVLVVGAIFGVVGWLGPAVCIVAQ